MCDQKDHDNEEILKVCLNIKCQQKRACCQYFLENHQSHRQELKPLATLLSWQKEQCQNYQAFRQKMDQILNIIKFTEKYLSQFSVDPETSFVQLSIDDFEEYISQLLKIQEISQPFNKLLSDLLLQLEPLTQLIQFDDNLTSSTSFDKGSVFQKSKKEKQKRMIKYNYQELLEKTFKIRKQNELDIHQYPTIHRKSLENLDEYKTIILIGTCKSGKQQLINLFLNYYQGVNFNDPFRFEMIDDIEILKDKQNDEYFQTKVYYITPQNTNPGLRIIYTPDYSEDISFTKIKLQKIKYIIY